MSRSRTALTAACYTLLLTCYPSTPVTEGASKKPVDKASAPSKVASPNECLPPGAVARLGTTRFWHHSVFALSFAPDGATLASGGSDGTVRVWEVPSGREVHRFVDRGGSLSAVYGVAFSPDGKLLASADKTIRVHEVATGKVVHSFEQVRGEGVRRLAFSPDGKSLVAVDTFCSNVRMWEIQSGKEIFRLKTELDGHSSLAFCPDGKTFAVAGRDTDGIEVWDAFSGKKLKDLMVPKKWGVASLAYAPDGKALASGCYHADVIILWNATTGKEVRRFPLSDRPIADPPEPFSSTGVWHVSFSPDGSALAAANGRLYLWDVSTGKKLSPADGWDDVDTFVFRPDGKGLATSTVHTPIRLWQKNVRGTYDPVGGHRDVVMDVSCSPDGQTVALADGTTSLWDLRSGKELNRLGRPGSAEWWIHRGCVAFTPDGSVLAAEEDRVISLWDVAAGKLLRRLEDQIGRVRSLSFSVDGKTVVAVLGREKEQGKVGDYVIQVWEVATGREVRRALVAEGSDGGLPVVFSADGRTLALADGLLRPTVWDVAAAREVRRLEDGFSEGLALALSPDGRTVAWLRDKRLEEFDPIKNPNPRKERALELWEVATGSIRIKMQGKCIVESSLMRSEGEPTPRRSDRGLYRLCFSPDGRLLACGNEDGILQLWDASTGQELCKIEAHEGRIECLRFDNSGTRLISGSHDTTALVWDVARLVKGKLQDWGPSRPVARQLDALWKALAEKDAADAYRASWVLTKEPEETMSFLEKKLSPVADVAAEEIRRLIKDLGADEFDVREKADQQLQDLCERAVPFLRQALADKPSPEIRRRAEGLLSRAEESLSSTKAIREDRALEILERVASPGANKLLANLAGGAPEARLTKQAKAALWRVKLRRPQ